MDALLKFFGTKINFVYHCFDRIVINGYLSIRVNSFSLGNDDFAVTKAVF